MSRPDSFRCWFVVVSLSSLVAGLLLLDAGQAQSSAGKKYALLVGVRDYESGKLDPLKYTENDAEKLADVLQKQAGFSVRVLTSTRGKKREADAPTTANLRVEIRALLARKKRDDTVLVALAGHGIQAEVTEGGKTREENFFCPTDAQLNDNSTLFSLAQLFRDLNNCGAGVKLLLVDACRNDPSAGRNVDVDSLPKPPRGMAALFSCKGGERAFETPKLGGGHGIFFHHVIEGLKGEAKNKKGEVTWSSLAEHVIDKVSDDVPVLIRGGARQTPEQKLNLTGKSPVLVSGKTSVVSSGTPDSTKPPVIVSRREAIFNSVGMKLVPIQPGKFTMGSGKAEQDAVLQLYGEDEAKEVKDWLAGEHQHEVEITKPYYLAVHEVTQGEHEKVMGSNPSHFSPTGEGKDKVKGDHKELPVEMVSWHDAVKFCKLLSEMPAEKKEGRVYRLPTEAEWEYACRAGTRTTFHFGNALTSKLANFDGSYPFPAGTAEGANEERTTAPGTYKANAWGLSDMHGNVQEWCADWYDVGFYQTPEARKDPTGPASGKLRVLRGGSWHSVGKVMRTAYRNPYAPDSRYDDFGFRVACVVAAP